MSSLIAAALDQPAKVLVVDDHKLFAQSLAMALEGADMTVVSISWTGRDAIRMAREHQPHVALVDLELPDGSGLDVGTAMIELDPDMVVIAVTAHTDPDLVKEAIACGFRGYLLKDLPLSHFVDAIKAGLAGQIVIPHRVAGRVTRSPTEEERHAELVKSQLTKREKDVLVLLGEGLGSVQIAKKLGVRNNTVRTHIQNILTKLQAHSRLEAVAYASRYKIIDPHRRW